MRYEPNNKSRLATIGLIVLLFTTTFGFSVSSRTLDEIQRDIDASNKSKQDLQVQEKDVLTQLGETDRRLSELQRDIDILDDQLSVIEQSRIEAEAELLKLEADLSEAETRLEGQSELIDKRLSGIYKQGDVGYVEVIIGSSDFNDFISRINYLKFILKSDTSVMREFKASRDEVQEKRDLADSKKQDVLSRERSVTAVKVPLDVRRQELADAKAKKESLLAQIHSDTALEEERLAAAYAEQQEIFNRSRGGGGGPSVGLIWPVPNHYINCPWGYHDCNVHVNRPHTGIDLPEVTEGVTVVSAAAAGEVVWAGWGQGGDSAYGIFVQINHPDGKSTVYGHLFATLVSVGENVSQGKGIGLAGTTGHSTGPHLHFEVYDPNNSNQIYGTVNPLEYLP